MEEQLNFGFADDKEKLTPLEQEAILIAELSVLSLKLSMVLYPSLSQLGISPKTLSFLSLFITKLNDEIEKRNMNLQFSSIVNNYDKTYEGKRL